MKFLSVFQTLIPKQDYLKYRQRARPKNHDKITEFYVGQCNREYFAASLPFFS